MEAFDEFEKVFGSDPNLAYDDSTRRRIERHRHSLEGELFIDKLLAALKITQGSYYFKPRNPCLLASLTTTRIWLVSSKVQPGFAKTA